jgi:hypothetical protein
VPGSGAAPTRAGTTGPPSPQKDWGRVGRGGWFAADGRMSGVSGLCWADESAAQTAGTPDTSRWRAGFGASTAWGREQSRRPVAKADFVWLEARVSTAGRKPQTRAELGLRAEVSPSPACGRGGRGERAARPCAKPSEAPQPAVLPSPCGCLHGEGPWGGAGGGGARPGTRAEPPPRRTPHPLPRCGVAVLPPKRRA